MQATVPLWAFVALGLAAPSIALVGVIITIRAESRRSHRNWLRQTKYEAYERLFTTYFDMTGAYGDYVDAPTVTEEALDRLRRAAMEFEHQHARTALVASLRVGFYMQMEMFSTWLDVHLQLEAAEVGKPPHAPHREWGGCDETRSAAAYDLGVRRDPKGWLGKWRDRGDIIPDKYVDDFIRQDQMEPAMVLEVPNPYAKDRR